MVILGITHQGSYNQAACIMVDGKIVAWSEEERFNRYKHSVIPNGQRGEGIVFPTQCIHWCLDKVGITLENVDRIAVGHSKIEEISRKMLNPSYAEYIGWASADWFGYYPPTLVYSETVMKNRIHEDFRFGMNGDQLFPAHQIEWYPHHKSHVASTVIPSGFDECNYMTLDGEGGENAGLFGYWDGHELHDVGEMHNFLSLGGFYEDFTAILGFKHHSSEGKTMGLACYGEPDHKVIPRDELFIENKDGFVSAHRNWYTDWIAKTIKGKPYQQVIKNDIMSKEATTLAATAQDYFEEIINRNFENLLKHNSSTKLALAGGSFLNCTSNGKLAKRVTDIFIQPASHDSGTALGAAILCHHRHTGQWPIMRQQHAYFGRGFTSNEVVDCLNYNGLYSEDVKVEEVLPQLIHDNKVVGYFQGRSEVGPRALCHRSILANPTIKENLDRVNKIKKREWWRPLAPTIAEEYLFDITDAKHTSPFMLMACQVRDEWRDRIPAVTHVDNSCRPQSVNQEQNPIIHRALLNFREMTGVPVFMNTSFNVGEPLVDSPSDAIKTFLNSDLDVLLIEGFCVTKEDNK